MHLHLHHKWSASPEHWFDEEMLERINRQPVFAIDAMDAPATPPAKTWTAERIAKLSPADVRTLQANAERLGDAAIVALCTVALEGAGKESTAKVQSRAKRIGNRRLVSRSVAFGMRGANLANRFWSRSGVMKDGHVVFALWADDIRQDKSGAGRYLLWAPNLDGTRNWSDTPGGIERLEHCKKAAASGAATGLLVYGRRAEGVLPDERALSVDGIDADASIALRVEKSGPEFWALWGGRSTGA